jgi:ATP-dependent metalloprotease FtsH
MIVWALLFIHPNLKRIDDHLGKLKIQTNVLLKEKQNLMQRLGLNESLNFSLSFNEIPKQSSEHFEVIKQQEFTFKDVGGHDLIKHELMQCSDLLVHPYKYAKYNVRTPKGIILEGPPGNGKTLLAKGFSGELDVGFIPVSGSQFQEKYVGVGASRVRELFDLAKENIPCIIFIDEIDAIGGRRTNGDSAQDHASTLNELLVNLDGFKSTKGIFVMGATNRVDLLDSALLRPGRIDKKIFVGNPDEKTRDSIIRIHLEGKPHHLDISTLVGMTNGFSGAQIENLLNEAMLYVLRSDRECITMKDIEIISTRILVGLQSSETKVSTDMLYQVAVHEMGHALVGYFTKHKKLVKVMINLWSPTSLGFTLFEPESMLRTKDGFMYELMILLGGRIAEELVCKSITTGASHDFIQAKLIAEKMVVDYGMGSHMLIPHGSDHYRKRIDDEIDTILATAYNQAKTLLLRVEPILKMMADVLVRDHVLTNEDITRLLK